MAHPIGAMPPAPNGSSPDGTARRPQRTLSRRGALAGTAAIGAAALAACTPTGAAQVNAGPTIPPAKGKVTVTYWAWLKDLQKVADKFNAQNDRIEVRASWIPGGDGGGYAKILSAVAANGGPDIAQVELRSVPEFALAGALTEIGRYGAADLEDKFDPGAFSQVRLADKIWAIPQDTGPGAMFYNREVLEEKMGLKPPKTWDEFKTLAEQVSDKGAKIMSLNPNDGSVLPFWAMQAGSVWFQPHGEGWLLNMTDERSLKLAEFWDSVLDSGSVASSYGPFSTPWMAAAGQGKMLSYIGGSWGDALVEGVPNGEGKWGVADMPRWEDGYASGGLGGSSAAVLSTAKHPAEALEFLTWMCTSPEGIDAMIEHCGIGWSPAKDYIGKEREKPSTFFSGENYNVDVIKPMARGQNLEWVWAPLMQRVNAILGDGMTQVFAKEKKLTDVLADSQNEIAAIMRKIGLDVEVAR